MCVLCFVLISSLVDSSGFAGRDGHDADSADGQQVEGGRTDDGARTQGPALEVVADDLNAREQDLGRRAAQCHEGQVGHCAVPDGDLNCLRNILLQKTKTKNT